jgi:primosomal protein N'
MYPYLGDAGSVFRIAQEDAPIGMYVETIAGVGCYDILGSGIGSIQNTGGMSVLNFGLMTDDQFVEFFQSRKLDSTSYEEQQEKIRKENERLKKEAEKKEKALELERKKQREEAENLAKIEAEKQAKIKADADVQLKREQEAKAKLEKELKAQRDAEIAYQKSLKDAEEKKRAEAEALLKQGDKAILLDWKKRSFLPVYTPDGLNHAGGLTAANIADKYQAFMSWADKQIEEF